MGSVSPYAKAGGQPASGFDAFGRTVPTERQVDALDTAVEQFGVDALLADPIIRDAARYVELDQPDNAMLVLRNITDLTGAYRLLAVLCTDSS